MSDDKEREEEEKALRALHEAANSLRRMKGEKELPYPYEPEPPLCSFCGNGKNEYRALVEGPGVYICDSCVEHSQHLIDEQLGNK